MSIRSAIERARQHVEKQALPVTVRFGRELRAADLQALNHTIDGPQIPSSVLDVYRDVGDGFFFEWTEPGLDDLPFDDDAHEAKLEFPTLEVLVQRREEYSQGWWVTADFSKYSVDDPELAHQSAVRMASWTWFFDEPNGDHLCIDFATGEVVYDQHDWHDAGTGENGHVMDKCLGAFLVNWASDCFTRPGGRYWPDAFTHDGMDWGPEFFGDRYQVEE